MTNPGRLDFVLAGGATHGLGHVMRCRAIAEAARERDIRVRAYLEGDAAAGARWCARAGLPAPIPWSAWRATDAADWTILDHPFDKRSWLERLQGAGSLAVVLDDERARNRADLTILPGLHHAPRPDDDRVRVWAGPRYSILSEAHRQTRALALSERDHLLLSMGGADPYHATPRLAPCLVRGLETASRDHGIRHLEVVLGPAFRDPGDRIANRLAHAGWQVHRALPAERFARSMARARFAVVGFGTSLTELAWHGTPHACLTHHEHDDAPARALEARGIGAHLGCVRQFDARAITARFRRALEDAALQRESVRRAREAIAEARGIERILDALPRRRAPAPIAFPQAAPRPAPH